METKITNSLKFFLLFLLLFFFISTNVYLCSAADTISSGQSISSNQTLISKDGNFALGFFRPGSSSPNCYLGIWYNKISLQSKTYIWVANRDHPLTDLSSSELKLLENSNLVLLNQSKIPIWSTNSTFNALNSSELVIGDDGNLVLRLRSESSVVLWQSFDHPTDTFLPGGKLRYDKITKTPVFLTSWKNLEDPSKGIFSLHLDPFSKQYLIYRNHSKSYWTSGPWNGQIFSLVPEMRRDYIFNYSYVEDKNESYFTYSVYNKSIMSRLVMDLSGQIKQYTWLDSSQQWNLFWTQPRQQCEVYAFCGTFGSCNQRGLPFCQCLQGFQPRSSRDWHNLSDTSGGCVKETTLHCREKDGFFLLLSNVKVPENALPVPIIDAEVCKSACLSNCSCTAYSFHNGCSLWYGDLLNIQQLYISDGDSNGRDLYVRSADHKEKKKKKVMKIIIITVIFGVVTIGVLTYISLRWMAKRRGDFYIYNNEMGLHLMPNTDYGTPTHDINRKKKKKKEMEILLDKSGNISEFRDNQELPFFNFKKLATATNNFDAANKLGQGGFGPVYKGKLPNGQEIAVKRFSRSSGQGIGEFKNEVVLISKLQHRNLVRLLGYCMEGEERMLIYEYMANKSLDAFIFEPRKRGLLDWRKRFEIIMGICRGIIYLHRDSRLRVIHRDLKASNILLDQELNPKISDFGMARIFGGDELQANTRRVVGTYGYMSPEYAMEGLFSEKSDVFSFGVLLLEIVSGKRNTSFYHPKQSWSLLGYAWKLWNEGKIQELIDPVTSESSFQEEILRCIHVGLLCVQDFAKDRPTMSSIVSMLLSEITSLPTPKQPAFTGGREESDLDLSQDTIFSNNNVSITVIDGR